MTHYDTLGADPGASHEQLRKAYLARARRLHPDQFTDRPAAERARAERAMQDLNAAWSVLSDPGRRRAYDASLRTRQAPSPTGRVVDARATSEWRPFDPGRPATPRPERKPREPSVARPEDMEIRGTAKLLRPGALLVMFGLMALVVLIAAGVASRDDSPPEREAPVVLPEGQPLGCADIAPVTEEVPCGDHQAVIWDVVDAGESCPDDLLFVYRSGVGGGFCVTRVD